MDHSGNNSGSMQSSSDEQDYDSRNEFNSSFGSISNNNPYATQPTLFDHDQAHNLQPFSHSPAAPNQAQLDLDLVWSRSSDPNNYSTLGNLTPLSSSSTSSFQLGLTQGSNISNLPSSLDGNRSPGVAPPNTVSDHRNQTGTANVVGKSSRKRTRASRRAPTTVISTDPTNFRQMVQEFTGIPAPPFSASPYGRGRLDLFRSGHLDALGPIYPFRPSAQKPLVSSTSSSSLLNNNNINIACTTSNNNGANSFPSNYQMNMQNPILTSTFQSLLQSNGSHLGTKSQRSLGNIASMDHELGVGQQHVNGTSLSEFSMQVGVGGSGNNNLTRSMWREEEGGNDDQDQHLGSFNGTNGGLQNGTGIYKMNGSEPISDFHVEKRMEKLEGTVDSWICPSD